MATAIRSSGLPRSARVQSAAALLTVVMLGCMGKSRTEVVGDEDLTAITPVRSLATTPSTMTRNFDGDVPGSTPDGFSFGRTGSGRLGRWIVRAVRDAPSQHNVLAQEDSDDTDSRFAVAVIDSLGLGDASVSVRCKPMSGRVDQACGLVWRYHDRDNYYLARANALEDNVNFYSVQDGRRREVKGWGGKVATGVWHHLRADMRGDHVEVYFDGTKIIDARDSRFPLPGKVGVWTKADSRTLFDDLSAVPIK